MFDVTVSEFPRSGEKGLPMPRFVLPLLAIALVVPAASACDRPAAAQNRTGGTLVRLATAPARLAVRAAVVPLRVARAGVVVATAPVRAVANAVTATRTVTRTKASSASAPPQAKAMPQPAKPPGVKCVGGKCYWGK